MTQNNESTQERCEYSITKSGQKAIPSAARVAVLDKQISAYEKPRVLYINSVCDPVGGQGIDCSARCIDG